ncbi:MAG: GAF domain-containing protein, partial [Candidatus Margulisiibacteriota bacterium]
MEDLFHVQIVRLRKDCENLKSEEDLVSVVFDFLKQANLMTSFSAFLTINHFGSGVLYGNSEFPTQLISERREQILSRFEKIGNADFRHRQLMLFIEERNGDQHQNFEVDNLVLFPMVLENKLEGALLIYSPTGILPNYDKYQLVSWVFQEHYFMISRKHQSLLYKKMEAMNEAREMIYCVMSIDDMLSILGDIVLGHAKADMAFLALYEGENKQVVVRASWNSPLGKVTETRISHFERDFPDNLPSIEIEDKGNMFELAKNSATKILKLNSVKLLRSDNPDIIDILIPEMLFIPLVIREREIGFLCVIRRMFAREKISDTDISILETIISLAASSIENNRLYEQTLKEQITQKELQVAQSIQMGLQAKIKPKLRNFQIF